MQRISREDVPVAIEGDGVELRLLEAGGLTLGFVRLPRGANLAPLLRGLPDDLCPCPHWGYMISGRVRMHTTGDPVDFAAGEAFYWGPGHAPEALEDSEYVDFSPTDQFMAVIDHVKSAAAA
jgi:hypothetical protein